MIIFEFIKSIGSPKFYGEVAHKRDGSGIGYLFRVTFTYALISLPILYWIKGLDPIRNFMAEYPSLNRIYSLSFRNDSTIDSVGAFVSVIGWFAILMALIVIATFFISAISSVFYFLFGVMNAAYASIFNPLFKPTLDFEDLVRVCCHILPASTAVSALVFCFVKEFMVITTPIQFVKISLVCYIAVGTFYIIFALASAKYYVYKVKKAREQQQKY